MIRFFTLFYTLLLAAMCNAGTATQTSQEDGSITWTWTGGGAQGTFANGEHWVVGPITLTNISPGWSASNGGSMINPNDPEKMSQGLCDIGAAGTAYSGSLNVAANLPKVIPPGSSLLSTVRNPSYGSGGDYAFNFAAVLTVLGEAPPAGSFRPPYFGTAKPLFNKSQLNFDVFRDLAPTPNSPKPMDLTNDHVKQVFVAVRGRGGANGSTQQTTGSAPRYGRELSKVHNAAALSLNLNYTNAQKEPLLIELVQRGIDIYGGLLAGYQWDADGGHRSGRKISMYIAGKALGEADILARCDPSFYINSPWGGQDTKRVANYARFHEDQQHFYVDQLAIDNVDFYGQGNLGMPAWSAQAFSAKSSSEPGGWGNGYRTMNGSNNIGTVLIVSLMGDRELWNHEAFFEYITDHFEPWSRSGKQPADNSTNGVPTFTREMWNTYFGTLPEQTNSVKPVEFDPPTGSFDSPVIVRLTSATSGATIRYTTDGTNPSRTMGTVYTGPVTMPVGLNTLKAIAYNGTDRDSTMRAASYAVGVLSAPVVSPAGGVYVQAQTITLSTSSTGATIHYTLDGSVPTAASPRYNGPFQITDDAVLKAVVVKAGSENSAVSSEEYQIGAIASTNNIWQSMAFGPEQTGLFTVNFTVTPQSSQVDSLLGLSSGESSWFTDLAAIVRFNPQGIVDAYDSTGYRATAPFPYAAGKTYQVSMTVNVEAGLYSAQVGLVGNTPTLIAENFRFRLPQIGVPSLSHASMWTGKGQTTVYASLNMGGSVSAPARPKNLRIRPVTTD